MDGRLQLLQEEIGLQHANLVAIAENIKLSISEDIKHSYVYALAMRLLNLAELHFATEEELMKIIQYKGLNEHCLAHKTIVLALREKITVLTPDMETYYDLVSSVNDWLIEHMQQEDKVLTEHLDSCGYKR